MDHPLLQPAISLCFLYAGILMGIVYELFAFIGLLSGKAWFQHLMDALCSIFMFTVFAAVSVLTVGGTMRFYCFLAAGVGFFIERKTLHIPISSIRLKMIHKSKVHSS